MDADKILGRAFAEMRREAPERKIATRESSPKREPEREAKRLRSHGIWLAAAAIAAGAFLTIRKPPEPTLVPAPTPDFVCWVGGVRIENRDEAMEIARRALTEVDERVAAKIACVNEILNLINE